MPKVLLPIYCVQDFSAVSATPATYGALVTTQELRNALDTDPKNYTKIWSGSDQPVVFDLGSAITSADMQALFGSDLATGFYWKVESSFGTLLGSDANYVEVQRSTNGSSWTTYTLAGKYGDGSLYLSDTAVKYTAAGTDFIETVGYSSSLIGNRYERIFFKTENSNIGANYKVYQLICGYLVTLATKVPTLRQVARDYEGAWQEDNPMGKHNVYGVKTAGERRKFTIIFTQLLSTERDILFNVFRYAYGAFPLLYLHDTSDKNSWSFCKWTNFRESEPVTGQITVEIEASEF